MRTTPMSAFARILTPRATGWGAGGSGATAIFIAGMLLATNSAAAAAAAADRPHTKPSAVLHAMQPLDHVAAVSTPALDLKKLEEEDRLRGVEGLPPRYAVPHPVHITPAAPGHGTWERLDDGTAVWRLRITNEDAVSINLGFTRYHMPAGARLFVYASDFSFVVRPFTSADNAIHGELWTPPVPGRDVTVELTLPPPRGRGMERYELVLGSINIGYRGFGDPAERSGACNVDVICPEGDDWRDEISSVAVISTGGSTFCTGFMVNNVRQDQTPYFMTARHCGVTAGNAPSLVTFWNYENSWCRPPGSGPSGGPGDGQLNQFNTGSVWRSSNAPSDFTLVELTSSPDPEWFVSFAGWNATPGDGPPSQWSVGIHHPATDEKRISFDYDPSATTSYLGNDVPGAGTHVRIIQWDLGTTEPGSSGSPLFDQNHRVIGQLHGGYASCSSLTSDWYGKFAVSWTGGGTPSAQLKYWLDPDDTGTLTLDTLSTRGMTVTPSNDVFHLGEVGGPFTYDNYEYTLSNNTANPVNYTVSLTNYIGLLINGDVQPISGTISPAGGQDSLTVTVGPMIYGLPADVYEEDIVFEDHTTGLSRTIRHTVEIGQTGITVTPDSPLNGSGPEGGPFTQAAVYTVTSTHPTAVNVSVNGSASWISVNGSTTPQIFQLNGIGDSAQVTVAFSAAANNLPIGLHSGSVAFTNTSGGAGDATRNVTLEVGRIVYHADDVPQPILDHTTIYSYVDVVEDFCIGNVEVDIDITHTWIGDLIVELQSPNGTVVRLHNRTGGSADDIVTRYSDSGEPGTTFPDGPGSLGDFNFGPAQGEWRLRVSDLATADQGTLNAWSLRLLPVGGTCPSPVLVHSFPFDSDPGWTTSGQWAFGVPCGCGDCGAGRVNPPSGYTGQYVYGYNLNGCYPNNMPEYALTSTAIDCSDLTNTTVSFWRWLGVERFIFDKARFQVSNNGTTWVTIWQNPDVTINESSWSQVNYNISALADGQPTVYLRWTMGPTDSSVTYQGWSIDDVEIWGVLPEAMCPGDLNDDGAVDVLDLLLLLDAWGPCTGCDADLNSDGAVDVLDLLLLLDAWGPCT
jgi:subtilisin-like proprotein convertase family protein